MGGAKCMKKNIPNAFVWAIVYQQNVKLIYLPKCWTNFFPHP
jgi:hypothetical protein